LAATILSARLSRRVLGCAVLEQSAQNQDSRMRLRAFPVACFRDAFSGFVLHIGIAPEASAKRRIISKRGCPQHDRYQVLAIIVSFDNQRWTP
jgi:hypothetical protein